jgi:hypothetical protein
LPPGQFFQAQQETAVKNKDWRRGIKDHQDLRQGTENALPQAFRICLAAGGKRRTSDRPPQGAYPYGMKTRLAYTYWKDSHYSASACKTPKRWDGFV